MKELIVSEKNKQNLSTAIQNQLKITNVSGKFINNIKLYFTSEKLPLLEQTIIRSRGALAFDPCIPSLELGNLAPNETAYFEYQFANTIKTLSLSNHIALSYTLEDSTTEQIALVNELLKSTSN